MINLLPPQYKKELKQEENFHLVLLLGIVFLFFLISLILILFSIKIYIQSKSDFLKLLTETKEKVLQTPEFQELAGKIISANRKISELESFYKTEIDLAATLEKIFQKLPPGIYLNSLSWQKETGKVTLSGFSASREILFYFKNNLEGEPNFSKIYFPSQSWIKPTNIFFQVTFNIKPLRNSQIIKNEF